MDQPTAGPDGARFFDADSRDLGWAAKVTIRAGLVSTLTSFDVISAEPALLRTLFVLDRRPLRIECAGANGPIYRFKWASGYSNGADVRIQGILEPIPR